MKKRWKVSLVLLVMAAIGGCVFAFTGCTIFGCKTQVDQFAIDSFQECSDAGYAVIPGDPPRCVIDDETIFTQDPEFVRVETPKPFQAVASPLLIQGQARAINNTVYYRLQSNDQVVLSEGSFPGNSPEHGRWGDIEEEIIFNLPTVPSGVLFLFEKGQEWDDESAVRIPINFAIAEDIGSENFDPLMSLHETDIPASITLDVPFTPQAPFANWNPPYDEACEEASLLMAEYYLKDIPLTRSKADLEIIRQYEWQNDQGYLVDIDTLQLAEVAESFYGRRAKVYREDQVTIENIQRLLSGGYPVIIPAAGQMLGNPNFRGAGPPYHMLIITGYDENGFITNDPGTRNGEDFRYSYETLMNAIHDWIGSKDSIRQGPKSMLVIGQ